MNNNSIIWKYKNEVIFMLGKIIDMNNTDAFVTFDDGTTMNIGVAHLKKGVSIGDTVHINPGEQKIINEKLVDYF